MISNSLVKRLTKYSLGKTINWEKEELLIFLDSFISDKNSSKLREQITLSFCNYQPLSGKHGYDGFDEKRKKFVEIKPQHILTTEKKKLNGRGMFSDFTWERYDKYLMDKPIIIFSGFIDTNLIYCIEVDFNELEEKFKNNLEKHFPNRIRIPKSYLRYIECNYNDYCHKNINLKYFNPIEGIEKYIVKNFLNFLKGEKDKNGKVNC